LPDGCDYDNGINNFVDMDQASVGLVSQYVDSIDVYQEVAETFVLKGTGENVCLIDAVSWNNFNTGWDEDGNCQQGGGPNCADNPSDLNGLSFTISADVPGGQPHDEKGPTCFPTTDPFPDGTHTCGDTRVSDTDDFPHPPINIVMNSTPCPNGAGDCSNGNTCVVVAPFEDRRDDCSAGPGAGQECRCDQLIGTKIQPSPPATGDWWEFVSLQIGGQASHFSTAHFNPPIRLEKNKKYWLAITLELEIAGKYVSPWGAVVRYDGQDPVIFDTDEKLFIEFVGLSPKADVGFKLEGTKEVTGCGNCTRHADVFPFDEGDEDNLQLTGNCVVDLDDILTVLAAFSAPDPCDGFPDLVNMFPCGQACPDGTVDLDDILSTLRAFSGDFDCDDPCPHGACCLPDTSCVDADNFAPGTTPTGGMSLTDCNNLGGSYQGDGTVCVADNCP
jgi:hypothetical protein